MKLKSQILILLTTILLLLSSVIFVYAYLESKKEIDDVNFNVGNLSVSLSGSLINDNYFVPGKELIDQHYKLTNTSTIKIDVQLIIEVKLDGLDISQNEYDTNDLIVISQDFTKAGDNYLILDVDIGEDIEIINSLVLNGYIVRNLYSGKKLEINIKFSAKQKNYATWDDIGILKLF